MEIRILGAHNFETSSTKLVSLLIDEVLAVDAGGLTSSLTIPEQEQVRTILLSHHHYDHIRDVPAIALATHQRTIEVYAPALTLDVLSSYLLDGTIYPKFTEWPSLEKPRLKLHSLEPYKEEFIAGYRVLALPVYHTVPTVGYQITSSEGKSIFYSSDTGQGLSTCWDYIEPQLLIVELTMPNRLKHIASESGHLYPRLLGEELLKLRQVKGYLPPVVLVHMNPAAEAELKGEIAQVAGELGASITLGYEGLRLRL
jgi:ribonuclease BN (tRNA processing enzyme)